MNGDRASAPKSPGPEAPPPADRTPGTGEGSSTALEALIRKRKLQADAPDARDEPEAPGKP